MSHSGGWTARRRGDQTQGNEMQCGAEDVKKNTSKTSGAYFSLSRSMSKHARSERWKTVKEGGSGSLLDMLLPRKEKNA